jgi:hypothetical protein
MQGYTPQEISMTATTAVREWTDEPLAMPSSALLVVIRGEFREMPGMRLTRDQFRRLWSLTPHECDRTLAQLLQDGFLVEENGRFARTADRIV